VKLVALFFTNSIETITDDLYLDVTKQTEEVILMENEKMIQDFRII